ncbi:MAG: YcaO-like family protein [Ruegeria sp.]
MPDASRKRYLVDTHRTRDPLETLAAVREHLPGMGITRVANLTGLDRIGLPTVMVTRPNSRSVAVSLGKGLSIEAAEASGVMEAIETWHAERIRLPVRLGKYSDLCAEEAVIDVERLPKVTGAAFDPNVPMLWIQGGDLPAGTTVWVPYQMVDTDYTNMPMGTRNVFPRTTNGLASGNNRIEATCHAICELIERDATTVWHFGGTTSRVNPNTVTDTRCIDALERFANAGIDVGIWETTTDTGVPSFHSTICESGDRPSHIGIGDGCHPDRTIALLRALTEAAQTRLTYISGARDDLEPEEFTSTALEGKWRYIREQIEQSAPDLDFADGPTRVSSSFEDDLDWLLSSLTSSGINQVAAVDLSRQNMDVSVVRAIIPGLEAPHDDPDFIPGNRALRAAGKAT